MGNSIGAVMDGFSGKRCTFFILIAFWALSKLGNMTFCFIDH